MLALLTAAPALGDGGNSNFRSEIDSVRPDLPGISFEVLDYDADMATGTPPQVEDESKRTEVFDYEVRLRIHGGPGAVDGTLYWVGPAAASRAPFLIAGFAIIVLGGVAVLIARRRRGGDDEGAAGKEAW